jgi:predicted dehydrogenase
MNVALVGDDPALVAWAARIPACGGRVLALLVDASLESRLRSLAPAAVRATDWRELMSRGDLSAVVVGGASPTTAAAASALARTLPLLVLPQSRQGGTEIALLDMHASPERPLLPAFLHRFEPAVRALMHDLEQGRIGDVRLIQLERCLIPPAAEGRIPHDRASETFFLDVDLLRLIGGDYQRVTAVRLDTAGDSSRQMTVTLASDAGPEAVWSLGGGRRPAWRLTVEGSRGTAVMEQPGEEPPRLSINGDAVSVATEPALDSCLRTFFHLCRNSPSEGLAGDPLLPTWTDGTRAFALTEALEESVRRRRTVVPRLAGNSERDQFKSQMTAIGCGVLCWAVVWVCVGLLLGQVLDPRDSVERRAAAAGTIVWREDFLDAHTLTDSARARLRERLAQEGTDAIVLIESNGLEPSEPSDDPSAARREAVREVWDELGRPGRPPQVEVRPLAGRGFRTMMLIVWGVAFAPLAMYLLAQLFLLTARA